VSTYRQQAHLDAPLERVWELVGTPTRYPEWWPRVIEVRGTRFEEGEEFAQVTEAPAGDLVESHFLLERRENLRGIRMSCLLSGLYAEWLLTRAAGGTFVELEMGMEPRRPEDRAFDAIEGKAHFRTWANQSLDGLRGAVAAAGPR
jgi:uncharacterized protein YndB with AHSA1/START domain